VSYADTSIKNLNDGEEFRFKWIFIEVLKGCLRVSEEALEVGAKNCLASTKEIKTLFIMNAYLERKTMKLK